MDRYELIVIGTGPAGEKAAVKAAYFGHRVAVVEKADVFGGAGVNTGTLPSKTLKETALFLSGKYDKGLYGVERALASGTTVENFLFRKNWIIKTESEAVHANLRRHGVDIYHGTASFLDRNTIIVKGDKAITLQADYFIIATGSYPFHPAEIPFDGKRVHDSDTILDITRYPGSVAILGAGVIGCEYATIFSTLGTQVYLINRSDQVLSFLDQTIVDELLQQMRADGIELLFDDAVRGMDVPAGDADPLQIKLESGRTLGADMFLFAAGRNGRTRELGLDALQIEVSHRETIMVNDKYQTSVPNIYAAGDVIGFPALASTGMDQGRIAVAHIFQSEDIEHLAQVVPYGIYTVPEISTAGMSEQQAAHDGISVATGVANMKDLPRGKIMGAKRGLLKLVFERETLAIRGVHIIGHAATELIHYGVELVEGRRTLMDVIRKVYNFPTLHDLYKYAAYDGLGGVAGRKIK